MTALGRWIGDIAGDRRKTFTVAVLAVVVSASVAIAASQTGSGTEGKAAAFSSDPEQARIEKVVHDYLLAHPEVLREAGKVLQQREMANFIQANRKLFETPFAGAWAGDEKGDVVLVEFFDYACGFCRASNADIERLVKEDGNLKIVWRELPLLGQESIEAAHASLAAARQGRFRQFHDSLFAAGVPTAEAVANAQKASGAAPAQSPDFQEELDRNLELARAINASGTPVFVVGDTMFQGAVGYEVLKQAIAEARKK